MPQAIVQDDVRVATRARHRTGASVTDFIYLMKARAILDDDVAIREIQNCEQGMIGT
jgi:hypothetical protein